MSTLFRPLSFLGSTLAVMAALASAPATAQERSADSESKRPHYVATIHPVVAILTELTRGRAEVSCLLPPAASPHTYEPRPSDARRVEAASAMFYVHADLDGWASRLSTRRRVELLPLVPAEFRLTYDGDESDTDEEANDAHDEAHGHAHTHHHGAPDPHFWSDPLAVKALLPALVELLIELDAPGADTYRANAADFAVRLDALHATVSGLLAPVAGRPIILFHPSLRYMLRRYNLRLAGVIEPAPGWEASPRYLHTLVETIRASGARAIFAEPQLPDRPARVLAEAARVQLALLDPNGGVPGRMTYEELILFNARALREALE